MMYQLDQIALLSFLGLLGWAAVSDGARFIIPNRVCAAIALLYPVHVLASPDPVAWLPAFGIAIAAMAVGTFAFSRGWAGGGDVKLFAASALWAGPSHFSAFALVTSLAGGVLAGGVMLLWLIERARLRARVAPEGSTGAGATGFRQLVPPYAVVVLWLMEKGACWGRPVSEDPGSTHSAVEKPALPYGIAIATGGAFVAVQLLRG